MDKQQMTKTILDAKKDKNVSWKTLAEKTNLNPVCVTAACLGSASLNETEAQAVISVLDLKDEVKQTLMEYPLKGNGQIVPSDPLIYRLYEIAYV